MAKKILRRRETVSCTERAAGNCKVRNPGFALRLVYFLSIVSLDLLSVSNSELRTRLCSLCNCATFKTGLDSDVWRKRPAEIMAIFLFYKLEEVEVVISKISLSLCLSK